MCPTCSTCAINRLCPELEAPIKGGQLTLDDAQETVGRAFDALVMKAVMALPEGAL